MTSDSDQPDPKHSVPRVGFGADEPVAPADESVQSDAERELQAENAETSLDQPSQ